MKIIDKILNTVTMYRLVVYGLLVLVGAGFWFSFSERLHFTPIAMAASLLILIATCYATDYVLSKIWRVPRNSESWLITALILFLILQPGGTIVSGVCLALAGLVAIASKYMIAWRGKHIFNPAALGAAFLSLTALDPATWWVGNAALWPFALVVGLLVVRKIRRFTVVLTFVIIAVTLQLALFVNDQQAIGFGIKHALISSPLIFLATIMLTEPATMPNKRREQMLFAAGIAVLYVTGWKLGPIHISPEIALLLGNMYSFVVSRARPVRMQLAEVQKISDRVQNYVFRPDIKFNFLPGQYMEWTLAGVPFDSRGNRRTFTIASSPTEDTVQIGVKFYDPPSMYKYTLSNLQPGDMVQASQLAGDFTLHGNEQKRLAFIAGGIGITPFRSMIKYLTDTGAKCDIVLLYLVSDSAELAYKDVLLAAAPHGVRVVAVTTSKNSGSQSKRLGPELIARAIPDYRERLFYVSGPNAMVDDTKRYLHALKVRNHNIRTDHFSGY